MIKKLKIGVFAYNFKHGKTQDGIINLYLNNIPVECIIAADPVELKFYQSKIRIAPKGIEHTHPKDIAKRMMIPYHIVPHASEECEQLIKDYNLDLGIVLGARIIKNYIIDAFDVGILNMHPGLLPENRGLDNLKWAITNNIDQGVTTHLIDPSVDRGYLIDKKKVPIYPDDTLVDVCLRTKNLEQIMMIEAIKKLENKRRGYKPISKGVKFDALPQNLEKDLMKNFKKYKEERK